MNPDSNSILSLTNLSIGYGTKVLMAGITASLRRGECAVILGGNGIGKSTLLRTIMREIAPLSGEISLLGDPLSTYSRARQSRSIALVSTGAPSIGRLRLRELVELGRQPHTGFLGRLSPADRLIVEECIERVGLADFAERNVQELSDGERQKALIARALAQETPLLILDEPFSFLDPAARIDIFTLLKTRAEEKGTGVLLTSHDVAQALRLSDTVWLMSPSGFLATDAQQAASSDELAHLFRSESAVFSPSLGDFVLRNDAPQSRPHRNE